MEPEGSLPHPQELSKIHLNIIHPPTSVVSFPMAFPPITYTRTSSRQFVLMSGDTFHKLKRENADMKIRK
jgi:hypothetical protein